ncbi:MAG: hypothetical protein JXQ87_06955 [Bacteroidia bacterium]
MYQILLYAHIIFGLISLITGAMASFAAKKRGNHTKSGKWFVISMLGSAFVALLLTFLKPNPFLLSIGLFTVYMTLMGFYAFKSNIIRKYLPFLGIVIGLLMLYVALFVTKGISIVALVFGIFQLVNSVMDLLGTIKNRVVLHASRIGGAYIASSTAFMVTAVSFLPWYVGWFVPSVVGSILLSRAIGNYLRPKVKYKQSA